MKKFILLLIITLCPLFMFPQPECMIIQSTNETITDGVGSAETTMYYSWDDLTSYWNSSDNNSSGYNIYNSNGDIIESFTETETYTILTYSEYDSENRIIEVINESSIANNNYIINYNWDGLTATISYSGDLNYSGYQIVNSNGSITEQFMDYGPYTYTTYYEYDSENRITLMSTSSSDGTNNTIMAYSCNGLTATISYSVGDLEYTGYQTINSNGYITEYFMDYGVQTLYMFNEYNCNNSSLIETNNSKKLLINIDLLGRLKQKKGFNIEIYNDGSVEKKYVVE